LDGVKQVGDSGQGKGRRPRTSIFSGLRFFVGEFSVTFGEKARWKAAGALFHYHLKISFSAAVVPAVYFIAEGVLF
jgi:hypothetical protein